MAQAKKKRRHRLRIFSIILLIFFGVTLIGGLIYIRVQGFKSALVDLVDTASDGKLALQIEETEIDYIELDFRLSNLNILSVSDSSNLESVYIPYIDLNLGSLWGVISGGQFEFEHFVIAEPLAKIRSKEKKDTEKSDEPVNLAHEIALFYPAIKAVLERFDIHEFRIRRAGFTLQQPENVISLRFIDLLVNEWNMRDLEEDANLHFSAGAQELQLNRSAIGFSEINFDYKSGELRIEDYSFDQADSLGRPVINLEGASVVISNLDYDALMDEKYIFDELTINNPSVTAYVYPHEKKTNASRQPISDLLKRNLGELLIRNGSIQQAELNLLSYNENDTVRIRLPRLDFSTQNFTVTRDTSTLMMETLKLDIAGTSLDLGNDLGVSFDRLSYNERYDALIQNISITDLSNGMVILQSDEIDLFRFNIFNYIYNLDLTADSIKMRGGNILLAEDISKFRSDEKKQSGSQTQMHVGSIELNRLDLFYNLKGLKVQINDLTAQVKNLTKEESLDFKLRQLYSPRIKIRDDKDAVSADIQNISFTPRALNIRGIDGNYQGLKIELEDLSAMPEDFNPIDPDLTNWNSLIVSKIKATGPLPAENNNSEKKEEKPTNQKINLEKAYLRNISISLQLNDSTFVQTNEAALEIDDLSMGGGLPSFRRFLFSTDELIYNSPSTRIKTGPINLDNSSLSSIETLELRTKTNDTLMVGRMEMEKPVATDSIFTLQAVRLQNVQFNQTGSAFISHADSVAMNEAMIRQGGRPYISSLSVYGTKVSVNPSDAEKSSEKKGKKKKSSSMDLSKLFGTATIYPGSYAVGELMINYGKIDLNTAPESKHVDIHDLELNTKTSSFLIGRIETIDSDLKLTNINIEPSETFVPEYETDIVGGTIPYLLFEDVSWNDLFSENKFLASALELRDFNITLQRDKRQTDPPPVNKPHLFSELIPVSDKFSFQEIRAQDGSITYMEIGEKTGLKGRIRLEDIAFKMNLRNPLSEPEKVIEGTANLYGQGNLYYNYARLDSQKFDLEIRLTDYPVDSLNLMVTPLEAVELKSGYIREFDLSVRADSVRATGQSLITYDDLHIEIFKRNEPGVRNFGSEFLTLLADGIILKHSKTDAIGNFEQERITFKGPINYWVKTAINGAMRAIRKGKDERNLIE